MNFAAIGIIAFLVMQMGIAGACALLYSRMRSKADAQQASMMPWGIKVEAAVGTAQAAMQKVEVIELEHYKNLRSMFESQALQIGQLKGEIETLKRENEQLTTKVQTLQRMDRGARKRESEAGAAPTPGPGPMEGSDGPISIDDLVANGQAIPLRPPVAAKPAVARSSFGRIP